MRHLLWGSLTVCLVLGVAAWLPAQDKDETAPIIDQAIKAAGGEEKLNKFKAATFKGKGTAFDDNKQIPIILDGTMRGADQWRLEMEANDGGRIEQVVIVFNKDKAWAKPKEKPVEEAPEEVYPVIREELHLFWLAHSLTALKDKEYTRAPLGEVKVNDRPALGIKVSRKDYKDLSLYFDKKTGHLVKAEFRIKDMKDGQEAAHEIYFSEPKEMEGVQHFSRIAFNRDGKRMFDFELSEVKPLEKVDDSTFEKPS